MRERGSRTARGRPRRLEPVRSPTPATRSTDIWQVIAIIALIAATAGWTTVAVITLGGQPVAEASPTESLDSGASEEPTIPPVADTHDAPELESLLPQSLDGTALQIQSWTGDAILTDDGFSTSITTFLEGAGKTAEDLHVAQAYDPTQVLDASVGVYRVDGIEPTALHDALVAAWKVDYPDVVVSEITLDGKPVTKLDFGTETIASYFYVRDDVVFDVETTDEALATKAFAALPVPGASPPAAPASGTPIGSPAPSAAPS